MSKGKPVIKKIKGTDVKRIKLENKAAHFQVDTLS